MANQRARNRLSSGLFIYVIGPMIFIILREVMAS